MLKIIKKYFRTFNKKKYLIIYNFKKKIKHLAKISIFVLVVLLLVLVFFKEKHAKVFMEKINQYYKKQIFNINYNICNRLVINGIKYSNLHSIQKLINDYCTEEGMTIENLRENILKNPWVKDVFIQKKFPNSLVVNIMEYNPFAITVDDKKKLKLIDEFGDVVNIGEAETKRFNHLFMITGENFKEEVNNLFNLLSVYYDVARKATKARRIGSRRWDLILNNNVVVKLPEENDDIAETWMILDKIINIYGFDVDLEEIDLRLKDRIFLKYKSRVMEEIKNR